MQTAIRKQLWFTSYLTGTTRLWNRTKQAKPASSRYDLFRTCDELPLSRFIRCLCNEEYSQLVRTGTAPEIVLLEAWGKIYLEYVELSGSTETIYVNQLSRDMMLLSSRIDLVITIVRALQISPDKRLVDELKELGLPFKYNYQDLELYYKDLEGSIHWLAQWRLEYTRLEKELAAIMEANKEGGKVDRSYFDATLARLSKYNRYQVRANDLSVAEFIAMLKDYLEFVDRSNRKADGKQG